MFDNSIISFIDVIVIVIIIIDGGCYCDDLDGEVKKFDLTKFIIVIGAFFVVIFDIYYKFSALSY